MAVQFTHDWTHSFNKDKVTNQKWQNAQTKLEDVFNEDAYNEWVSIAVLSFWDF